MMVVDGQGLPLGSLVTSASPYEGNLLEPTLDRAFAAEKVHRVIADKGYDDDKLRKRLAERDIDLIAPNRHGRVHKTQDLRKLRRYNRRWIVERTIAWLHNYRRLVTRWERHVEIYTAFLHVVCILLILARVLK
jgi:transposase